MCMSNSHLLSFIILSGNIKHTQEVHREQLSFVSGLDTCSHGVVCVYEILQRVMDMIAKTYAHRSMSMR